MDNISNTGLLISSENTNNENIEKEILQQNILSEREPEIITNPQITTNDSINNSNLNIETDTQIDKDQINYDNSKYAENVTYNKNGDAIYTDPDTKYQYKWSLEKNEWISYTESITNPYENEHYRWCSETNQWIPKLETKEIENEFYKWNIEKNCWIPKTQTDVIYNYEDGVHTYTDKDGIVFFWDKDKNAWFPKITDEFMARYQLNYGTFENTDENDEKNKIGEPSSKIQIEKQELNELNKNEIEKDHSKGGIKRKVEPKWFDIPTEQNTKVYVTNLPLDITEEEFVQIMSKCGLIMRDVKTQKHKVKLYCDSNGQLKGDGLCDYIRIESVKLALEILDSYDIRGHKIKVQQAKFEMRGNYNPALKPKKKKTDKEKIQKMKEKLFDWRPEKMRGERSKHEKVVIIKNLFTPELFDKEVHLIIDYQNELREECSKCGTVRKVTIFDRHPEGVAQISMSCPDEADQVVTMMNGRFFGKRQLIASIWDGKTKFKICETDTETQKRLSNWNQYLELEEKVDVSKNIENSNDLN